MELIFATIGDAPSQSEIDRVNKALGGMNRGPDERLKVYQRAKQKFSKLMAWNSDELAAMADTGSDDSQIRRTQILQALGELDGILSVLPPEVRGRVLAFVQSAKVSAVDGAADAIAFDPVEVSADGGLVGGTAKQKTHQQVKPNNHARHTTRRPKTTIILHDREWAKPGDIVVFDFSHVGIVESDSGYQIVTLEGNTNGRGERDSESGDGVWRMVRQKSIARNFIRIRPVV